MKNLSIKEDMCSERVCKLLKKRGFKSNKRTYTYRRDGTTWCTNTPRGVSGKEDTWQDCSHALAMKWLRVNFGASVEVFWKIHDQHYHSTVYPLGLGGQMYFCGKHKTYDGAVEAALIYALEKLKYV